ncbi:hypothetical protein ACVWZZ_003880 [Bradyrhizobium sp. LM6.10]
MNLSEYLKPAGTVVFVVALGVGYYLFEHRRRPEAKETPSEALVIVTKSTNACFSDLGPGDRLLRAAPRSRGRRRSGGIQGHRPLRHRRHAGHRQSGAGAPDGPAPDPGPAAAARPARSGLAEGLCAGPRHRGPHHRRCAGLAAGRSDVPHRRQQRDRARRAGPGGAHAQAQRRRDRAHQPRRLARFDRASQAGGARNRSHYPARARSHQRHQQSLAESRRVRPRASIDAKRSCGVAVPKTAIDHLTVQVVKGNIVETRKVRVGLSSDSATEILQGLDVGEIVVADAGSSLHDGDQIKTMFADELDRTRVR